MRRWRPFTASFEITTSPVFAFDLISVNVVNQDRSILTLTGTGLFHLTGFENTTGSFFFSSNASRSVRHRTDTITPSWHAGLLVGHVDRRATQSRPGTRLEDPMIRERASVRHRGSRKPLRSTAGAATGTVAGL